MLLQPRCGVPLIEGQLSLFRAFRAAGVPVLSYQVDSLTRSGNYAGAEEAVPESRATGVHTINWFPLINYGVGPLRRVASRIRVPLQIRHSARDPRLLAEIDYAGGANSFVGGAICCNVPFHKSYPLAESIRNWQYVDRLWEFNRLDYTFTPELTLEVYAQPLISSGDYGTPRAVSAPRTFDFRPYKGPRGGAGPGLQPALAPGQRRATVVVAAGIHAVPGVAAASLRRGG